MSMALTAIRAKVSCLFGVGFLKPQVGLASRYRLDYHVPK